MKKKSKPKVKQCPCACVPPPRKRRQTPAYSPRPPPQFYSPLPIPQSEFHADTVKRIVQDEFKRYHAPRQVVTVSGIATQTDVSQPDFESISRVLNPLSMSAALEEVRRVGSDIRVKAEEQEKIEMDEALEEGREKVRRRKERLEREAMEAARRAFMPTPTMSQPEEL